MKFKIYISVFIMGSLLLTGCDFFQEVQERQALQMVEDHEEEINRAVEEAADRIADDIKVEDAKIVDSIDMHEASAAPIPTPELPSEPEESKEVTLAKCLTIKGARLYTASWCGHCQKQKEAFKDGVEYLDNTECAVEGGWAQECEDDGIEAVPTWIFADGEKKTGNTPLTTLAELSGCTY